MSSDPSERRRRSQPGMNQAGSGRPAVLALIAISLPVIALAQGLNAADRTKAFDLLANPSYLGFLLLAFVAVMVLNGIFVAGDVAVDALKPSHVKAFPEESRESRTLGDLLKKRDAVVAASVLGAQTMRSWLIMLCFLAAPWFGRQIGLVPQEPTPGDLFWGSVLAALILSIPAMGINVAFFELVGKAYGSTRPVKASLGLAGILTVFTFLFQIPGNIAMKLAGLVTQRFGTDARFSSDSKAEEEIREILESSEESGEIEEDEREMLHSVFEFGDTVAREVMTPRVDVESVPITASLSEIAALVEQTGHSRFPVYQESDDHIIGIVHAKDLLGAFARGQGDIPLSQLIRPAVHVPENKDLHELLSEMKAKKVQLAILADEFGATAGIVTIEDIIEEIVGEIADEYDNEVPEVTAHESGYLVSGKLHIDDVNDTIGTEFESEEFDTIGGYVFGLFGRQPKVGESLEEDGFRFTIAESDGRRILRVHVEEIKDEETAVSEVV